MNRMTHKQKLFLLVVFSIFPFALVAAGMPEKPSCPDVIQQGEVWLIIPAQEKSASVEVQITSCAGMNIQASGGSYDPGPVVINAIVHHDVLILSAHRLEPVKQPLEVVAWWRLN